MRPLHRDSGDPSGVHWSVAQGAAEPADIKVESHQQSSTMLHSLAVTGLSGGGKGGGGGGGGTETAQTTLELCPVTVHQPKQSQAG